MRDFGGESLSTVNCPRRDLSFRQRILNEATKSCYPRRAFLGILLAEVACKSTNSPGPKKARKKYFNILKGSVIF